MKKNGVVFLLFMVCVGPLKAYNMTEAKQAAGLVGLHILSGFIPDGDAWFGTKFAVQFGTGIHDPRIAVVSLATQYIQAVKAKLPEQQKYDDSRGAAALSTASSMLNRWVALEFAEQTNQTVATGYLLAAGLDVATIKLLPSEGAFKALITGLTEWKVAGALTNAVEHNFLEVGYSPVAAALLTSAATGGLAVLLKFETDKPPVATALIAETGFRLLPSAAKMVSPELISQEAINWALGVPLILLSNRMKPGAMNTFVGATGCAFLIGAVAELVDRLKKLAI